MEGDSEDDEDQSEEENKNSKPETSKENGSEKSTWEDIYGRTRDSEGNVVKSTTAPKYVPPALRAQTAAAGGKGADAIALAKLSKQVNKKSLNVALESLIKVTLTKVLIR